MSTVEEVYEGEITRTVTRRTSFKIKETSSKTRTTTMTTPAKLVTTTASSDLKKYEDMDVDQLLSQLSAEEIQMLAKEVDPDDSLLPPSQRCSYECAKEPTGPLNRKKLIEHINKQALETPDKPEHKPYVAGTVRGKKWIAPQNINQKGDNEKIKIDLDDEYEVALNSASQEEIIDLAAILGFHSMMNQDQYHASLLNKGQPVGVGWDGITRATQPKAFPPEPPNNTDPDESIKRVKEDDHTLIDLNWNNIKNISDEKFEQLFAALPNNTHLETLSLSNTGLMDRLATKLAEAIEKNYSLKVVNVETNFISPPVIVRLIKALLKQKVIEEFRASNQRSQVLGNKIEMEITKLIEQNPTILRLGLHLEYNDARHRISAHLQRNLDRSKGESIWDHFLHTQPHQIRDGTSIEEVDRSCDFYHKFRDDIKIVKDLGLNCFRFSISWCRVLPTGNINDVNEEGINFYHQLIDEIVASGIEPLVTLYHYDLPQKLQDMGGWCNPNLVTYFVDYARLMFEIYGPKVKLWTTFNEPTEMVHGFIERRYAPFLSLECFDADYIVGHNLLKAHGKAYRVYEKEFKPTQKGRCSIVLCGLNFKPKTDSEEDKIAAIRARQFTLGWFAHPIYSEKGDYPPIMRELIDKKSAEQGDIRSKLPKFTAEEIEEIKGTSDFFSFNHYTSALASDNKANVPTMYRYRHSDVFVEFGKEWPPTAAHWAKICPWGLREALCWIKEEYNNPPVFITENGFCDHGELQDVDRIKYIKSYLTEAMNAVDDHKCNVIGYNIWTLLDCLEWLNGYSHKYGLVHVNFKSPNRERTLKLSASYVKRICELRGIPDDDYAEF